MSRRTDLFSAARNVIRAHPELTDEEVAERISVGRFEIPYIVVPARRDVEANVPESRVTTGGALVPQSWDGVTHHGPHAGTEIPADAGPWHDDPDRKPTGRSGSGMRSSGPWTPAP